MWLDNHYHTKQERVCACGGVRCWFNPTCHPSGWIWQSILIDGDGTFSALLVKTSLLNSEQFDFSPIFLALYYQSFNVQWLPGLFFVTSWTSLDMSMGFVRYRWSTEMGWVRGHALLTRLKRIPMTDHRVDRHMHLANTKMTNNRSGWQWDVPMHRSMQLTVA